MGKNCGYSEAEGCQRWSKIAEQNIDLLRVNLWWLTHVLLPMGEGQVSLPDLPTWAKLELVILRDGILCAVPACLFPPCAPQ